MKTKLTILLLGILLFGTAVAGIIGVSIRDREIPREEFDLFKGANITEWNVSEISCDETSCNPIMIKNELEERRITIKPYWTNCSVRNETSHDCITYENVSYSNAELETIRDKFVDEFKEQMLRKLKYNRDRNSEKEEKVGPEEIIFKKKIAAKL